MSAIEAAARLLWSSDFIVIDGETPAATALVQIEAATARWVVIRRRERMHLYALRVREILDSPALAATRSGGADLAKMWLVEALNLHEYHASAVTTSRSILPPIDRSGGPDANYASMRRYVYRTATGEIVAVGVTASIRARGLRGVMRSAQPAATSAPVGSAAPEMPPAAAAAESDEGSAPVRHPSIEADVVPAAGQHITLTVDAKREAVEHTHGAVDLGTLPADWTKLPLNVVLVSRQIDFDVGGEGQIVIHRNADSDPAIVQGRVRADVKPGAEVAVSAKFWSGTRLSGMAMRVFTAAGAAALPASAPATPTIGTVAVECHAAPPDITVDIEVLDKDRSGKLRWRVFVIEKFDGLPGSLTDHTDMGHDTAAAVASLFKEFAKLEPGKHRNRIEGFGAKLWRLAPRMFHDVYWALWDRYKRPLTIQFITNEPHLPWELMCPVRDDESEFHEPLALKHATARWITRYEGGMRNDLPGGRLCTIAPKYASVSVQLQRAEAESAALVDKLHAQPIAGTHQAVTELFEHPRADEPVAVVHFAGHGKFSTDMAANSFIKLEGTDVLAVSEIDRPQVRLGRACRTLVFFNACEVGATATVFGEVGGWADAFLARQFGGFIAPLWSIEDNDAGVVSAELLERIYAKHEMISEALRAIREKYGDRSPTFFSYLYYGDVTARVGASAD